MRDTTFVAALTAVCAVRNSGIILMGLTALRFISVEKVGYRHSQLLNFFQHHVEFLDLQFLPMLQVQQINDHRFFCRHYMLLLPVTSNRRSGSGARHQMGSCRRQDQTIISRTSNTLKGTTTFTQRMLQTVVALSFIYSLPTRTKRAFIKEFRTAIPEALSAVQCVRGSLIGSS